MPNSTTPDNPLTPGERAKLDTLARSEQASLARRARIVLAADQGLAPAEIAEHMGLAEATVKLWLRAFAESGMAIFPAEALDEVSEEAPAQASDMPPTLPTVEELCRRYDVDMAHARHVGQLAAELFDLTRPVHQLDERYRDVAFLAGVLHNIAFAGGVAKHHTRGRDILLENPLSDLSDADRALIAVTTAFHRKAWKPERLDTEPAFLALDPEAQPVALTLAALVRIADGLDYSQSQTTLLGPSQAAPDGVRVTAAGPFADGDGARADQKADLWRAAFAGTPITITPFRDEGLADLPSQPEPVPEAASSKGPGLLPDDPMSEAGRKVLRFHFERMLANEPGTREGLDIEALHDMRVATRRMRAAFRVFGAFYKPRTNKRLLRELRRTAAALGEVRDLDVFMENAQAYLAALPTDRADDLDPLFARWQKKREKARRRMLAYLDSPDYQTFVQDFREFVDTPGMGSLPLEGPAPDLVRYVAPRQVYARYEEVRAYEPLLDGAPIETLHALRISAKRLRYTLEFFREVLGDECEAVIAAVVQMQDHLGALHDADVAQLLLVSLLAKLQKQARKRQKREPEPAELPGLDGVAAYLQERQQALLDLQQTFPNVWQAIVSTETRRRLALAVSVL